MKFTSDQVKASDEYRLYAQPGKQQGLSCLEALARMKTFPTIDGEMASAAVRLTWEGESSLVLLDGINASQLMALDIPEPRWIVDDFLCEGLTILAGKPKLGKSWFALALGIDVATGGGALNSFRASQSDVLYLALEDSTQRLKKRLVKMLSGSTAPDNFFLYTQWPHMDDGGLTTLLQWLDCRPRTRLIMIDTLAKIRPPRRGRGNVYDEDYGVAQRLHDIAIERKIAIVVLHHQRKMGSEDRFDTVSGSFGLTGAADSTMILERDGTSGNEAKFASLSVTGRDIEEKELLLRFNLVNCRWELVGDDVESHRTAERQEVVEILRAAPNGMKPKEIAERSGRSGNSTRQLLLRMIKSGDVVRDKSSLYTLPPDENNEFTDF